MNYYELPDDHLAAVTRRALIYDHLWSNLSADEAYRRAAIMEQDDPAAWKLHCRYTADLVAGLQLEGYTLNAPET